MGSKKEYRQLPGSAFTVLGSAVSAFAAIPEIKTIVITVPNNPETGETAARNALPPELLTGESLSILFVPGGKTRSASVYNALSALAARTAPDYVLIHDGARPWVSQSLIENIISGVKKYQAVIPLLPLTETPKETDLPLADSLGNEPVFIKRQLKRAVIGTAQTPQAFAFPEIFAAHEAAASANGNNDNEYTDDAEVWAAFCGSVAVIPGEPGNRKITFPEDLSC